MSPTTISISADYLALVRRYAGLAGMTAKTAVEYAIDRTLVPELEDYLSVEGDTEVETLTKAANSLLPESWSFSLLYAPERSPKTLVGLDFGFAGTGPTHIPQDDAQAFRRSLYDLPISGGRVVIGGSPIGYPVLVRRQGQGILFQPLDGSTGKPTGAKATIASKSAPRIAMAIDSIISAARKQDEEQA